MRGFTRVAVRTLLGLLLIAVWAGVGFTGSAAQGAAYTVESRLWFEGNSTLGKWACRSVPVEGELALPDRPGSTAALADLLAANPDTAWRPTLRFPVKKIRCEEGQRMNNHLRTALKADEHPAVTFRVEAVKNGDTEASEGLARRITGRLTVSGTPRAVTLPVSLTVTGQDTPTIRIRGKHKLDMTQYDVTPPTLMYGTISVHKPVTVHVDLELKPSD